MNNKEFVAKIKEVADKYKTLYVMGCFGAPMTASNKTRYCNNHSYNKQSSRTKMIKSATADTFGFDCVCLIKGVLWGWNGDKNKTYGGATYGINNVPDIGADSMITKCSNVSTDFSKIEVGEAVWMSGHIGVYVGNGQVVECTPKWDNCVQYSNLGNVAKYKKGNYRVWTKHGKLPYISYVAVEVGNTTKPTTTTTSTKKKESKPANATKPATSNTTTTKKSFKVGDKVKITGTTYYPGSLKVPAWARNEYTHVVTQTKQSGKKVVRGGKECVLLGKKMKNGTTKQSDGINTWVAIDNLTLVTETIKSSYKTYTVKSGDTLWGIAEKMLGNGKRFTEIKSINGMTTDVIHKGDVLKIPNK